MGLDRLLNGQANALPRPAGTATNLFGPNANILALTIEVPSISLGQNNSLILAWGRVERDGMQFDRVGRPLTNKFVIPPVPRGSNFPVDPSIQNRTERRAAFNLGLPRNDVRDFKTNMVALLQNFYGRNSSDANALSGLLLPDGLIFQLGNANGYGTFVTSGTGQGGALGGTVFGNGRRLRDDVADVLLNLTTNGGITSENVPDDNATRITDGNMGTVAAFPYIGSANASPDPAP